MKIAVISEGHDDRAVIKNLLKGTVNVQHADVIPLRPIDSYDETDLAFQHEDTLGGWSYVKRDCETPKKIKSFLSFEGNDFVIIHLDTSEAREYGVSKPSSSSKNYTEELRNRVINQINNWLNNNFSDKLIYAIAIEETEAWLLTILENRDSSTFPNPKRRLHNILRHRDEDTSTTYGNYLKISDAFSKARNHIRHDYRSRNKSLDLFCEELTAKIIS